MDSSIKKAALSLNKGDKIAIVAPAGRVKKGELDANINWLKSVGFIPVLGKNVYKDYFFGYHYAGNDEERLSDLQWAISDPTISAIWCARGGYGSVHLVDNLDLSTIKAQPKFLLGYSDITVLHHFFQKNGLQSIHTITTKNLSDNCSDETHNSLLKVLKGEKPSYKWDASVFNEKGDTKGILLGGNLSMIYSLVGSKHLMDFSDTVIFIEDWRENWYALDRMLMNLIKADCLKKVRGIVIGGFTKMDSESENLGYETPFDKTSYSIIKKRLEEIRVPKAFGFPAGHINDNRSLIFGAEVSLEVSNKGALLKFI